MRSLATRFVPVLTLALAACTNNKPSDDTDADTDTIDIDDTDTDTDVQDTDPDDTDTDVTDTDTDLGPLTVADLNVGDLVVTEFMSDPVACADPNGEYIEVFYRGTRPVDLNGLVLSNSTTSVTNTKTTIVQPGSYVLLVRQSSGANCYGMVGDWVYPTLSLADAGDEIKLGYGVTVFDEVDFTGSGWADSVPGSSYGFGNAAIDSTNNDNPDNWCIASTNDVLGATQDHGHPRAETACRFDPSDTAAEDAPVDLMLTEIMDYGPDANVRYIEVYNPNSTPVSLDGWRLDLYNNGSPAAAKIPLTSSAVLGAGETWVVAAPTMTSPVLSGTNLQISEGCAPDQYDAYIAGDGNDAVILSYRGFAVDVYGAPGVNGTGTAWDYTDGNAARKDNIRSPAATWSASEWTISASVQPPATWVDPSICRFDEAYVPPVVGDTNDTFVDTSNLFDGDTFETGMGDTGTIPTFDAIGSLQPGELVITEVMVNPTCGEESQYVEIMLLADHNISLDGLTLQIDALTVTFPVGANMRPYASYVLARTPTGQASGNCYFGGSPEVMRYSGMSIARTGSTLRLKSGAVILDSVVTNGLPARRGISWQFDPVFIDEDLSIDPPGTMNNDILNWCLAADSVSGSTDLGTPGLNNFCAPPLDTQDSSAPVDTDMDTGHTDILPLKSVGELAVGDLVITEFMADPASPCADEDGEYIEVLNNTAFRVDLQGLVVSTNSGSGSIGASLIVKPGVYAVLPRNPATTQCFRFGVSSAWKAAPYPANIALNQAGDVLSISTGAVTLDVVDFQAWTPVAYSGESWSLVPSVSTPAGNDTQSVWCRGGGSIGSQNIGTPGQQLTCTP